MFSKSFTDKLNFISEVIYQFSGTKAMVANFVELSITWNEGDVRGRRVYLMVYCCSVQSLPAKLS